MKRTLLEHYNRELRFIREMGHEFAKRYPKIAGRLDLERSECDDPYVERLLEGFALLAARIQLKQEAEFPRFTQHLLEMVYPHYLAPTPSMTIIRFQPDRAGGVTEEGFLLPRATRLRGGHKIKGRTRCEFRTAHDVMLWPVTLTEVSYLARGEAGRYAGEYQQHNIKAALRLRLETVAGFKFNQLALERLPLYLQGSSDLSMKLYELLVGHTSGIVAQATGPGGQWQRSIADGSVQPLGFDAHQAMLPNAQTSFQGYRLLHEYFALPQRYQFVELTGLLPIMRQCGGSEIELIILLNSMHNELEALVNNKSFGLYCTPAINLFPKQANHIDLDSRSSEHVLYPDKTRKRDFEVHSITEVVAISSGSVADQRFRPFYSIHENSMHEAGAYYAVKRKPTIESSKKEATRKAHYLGSDPYISLVDSKEAPYRHDIKQLAVKTLCTNRDLPMLMMTGSSVEDFTLWESGAPIESIDCLAGPTEPKMAHPGGEHAWRLISHLSLNYLTLMQSPGTDEPSAIKALLKLYSNFSTPTISKQIEGLISIEGRQVIQRLPLAGPICFGRGVEITVTFDESYFEGSSVFLFSAVLERFFSKYVSINSFSQTVVKDREQQEIMRWPVRTGTRTVI